MNFASSQHNPNANTSSSIESPASNNSYQKTPRHPHRQNAADDSPYEPESSSRNSLHHQNQQQFNQQKPPAAGNTSSTAFPRAPKVSVEDQIKNTSSRYNSSIGINKNLNSNNNRFQNQNDTTHRNHKDNRNHRDGHDSSNISRASNNRHQSSHNAFLERDVGSLRNYKRNLIFL